MKHTPIPEQLCSWLEGEETGFAEPLPPDLDRLFRASPKLADAFQKILDLPSPREIARERHYIARLENWVNAVNEITRDALALLED